jgi:hypothetical protein
MGLGPTTVNAGLLGLEGRFAHQFAVESEAVAETVAEALRKISMRKI